MIAIIGATNVQMAYVPLPEDNQQLQANCMTMVEASAYIFTREQLTICIGHIHPSCHIHHVLLQGQ